MTQHQLTFIFEDGYTARVTASGTESMYHAALRANLRLQSDCLEGACGTCKALCTSGALRMQDYIDDALSPEEAQAGHTLMCRALPTSDCILEVPYESALLAGKRPPAPRAGTVAEVERVSSTVVRLDIRFDDGQPMNFLPGQYVHLGVPGTPAVRYYSFAQAPALEAAAAGVMRFYVKLIPGGVMSDYLGARAKPGDTMSVTGPFGQFYLRAVQRPVLMVAGGTGLAPMLSMLDALVAKGGSAQPIHLLYGANEPEELFSLAQLDAYGAQGLSFSYECAVAAPTREWTGHAGHVTSLLRDELIHGADCDAYLCGPPPMIDAAQQWLQAHGLPAARIHAERFLAS
jgi:NAD(P)H-flavin reductase/ferredoxin